MPIVEQVFEMPTAIQRRNEHTFDRERDNLVSERVAGWLGMCAVFVVNSYTDIPPAWTQPEKRQNVFPRL